MLRPIRLLVPTVALAALALSAGAQSRVILNRDRTLNDPTSPISGVALRGGIMTSPRGAGLVGIDLPLPSLTLLDGFEGRLDVDVIFKANLAGVNTITPATVSLIHYSPDVAGRSVYLGAGVGALLGGKAKFDVKAVAGTDLSAKLAAEANVHWSERDTLVTLVARLKL